MDKPNTEPDVTPALDAFVRDFVVPKVSYMAHQEGRVDEESFEAGLLAALPELATPLYNAYSLSDDPELRVRAALGLNEVPLPPDALAGLAIRLAGDADPEVADLARRRARWLAEDGTLTAETLERVEDLAGDAQAPGLLDA